MKNIRKNDIVQIRRTLDGPWIDGDFIVTATEPCLVVRRADVDPRCAVEETTNEHLVRRARASAIAA